MLFKIHTFISTILHNRVRPRNVPEKILICEVDVLHTSPSGSFENRNRLLEGQLNSLMATINGGGTEGAVTRAPIGGEQGVNLSLVLAEVHVTITQQQMPKSAVIFRIKLDASLDKIVGGFELRQPQFVN